MPPAELVNWLQLAAIIGAGVTVVLRVGGREAKLESNTRAIEELGKIVADLVRFQVTHETNATHTTESLRDIKSRLDRLESSRWGARVSAHEER